MSNNTNEGAGRSASAKMVATLGMLSAIAVAAKLVSNVFPMVSGFLSFDLKDVVIVIAGFIFGPLPALAITVRC